MGIFLGWLIFSLVAGYVGSGRKIGFWAAFFLSLLLSPLIGLIIALVSKNVEDEEYMPRVRRVGQIQNEQLKKIPETDKITTVSIADEIEKLKKLKEDNSITEVEFQNFKNKIINS